MKNNIKLEEIVRQVIETKGEVDLNIEYDDDEVVAIAFKYIEMANEKYLAFSILGCDIGNLYSLDFIKYDYDTFVNNLKLEIYN